MLLTHLKARKMRVPVRERERGRERYRNDAMHCIRSLSKKQSVTTQKIRMSTTTPKAYHDGVPLKSPFLAVYLKC